MSKKKKPRLSILAIDPGHQGAFVLMADDIAHLRKMPIITDGKKTEIDFAGVRKLLGELADETTHVLLERAHPGMMGVTGAFNYGRGFAALEIAIGLAGLPVTYVESSKWTKVMHEGISSDMKPKAKSLIAVKRLYPKIYESIPKNRNEKPHDGMIDALLIAGYGQRMF